MEPARPPWSTPSRASRDRRRARSTSKGSRSLAGRLFAGLTVLENVELGAVGIGIGRREAQRWAWELLERLELTEVADVAAAAVPHGMERRLAIVRALA